MNNYVNNQAQQQLEQLQNYQKQISGEPVRVYPFKIVSGINYLSNRGLGSIGTNPGSTITNEIQETQTNIPYGGFSGLNPIYSGNRPIIAYWFGVVNATFNKDGTITQTINATQNQDGTFTPNQFANPLTAKSVADGVSGKEKWVDCEVQYPWKEVGVIDFSNSTSQSRKETLDNVEVGTYETTYHYSVFSNDWYPTYQEMNEFIYFVVDYRYPCPFALRIISITPHFLPNGAFQWCDIEFESINQYFNTSSRSIMTYVKFAAPNDAYAFPQEVVIDGERRTIINSNFLFPSTAGVSSICVKNNSLVAQLGTLLYGVPFVSYTFNDGVISRTLGIERYLIPFEFEAPINDNVVNKHSLVHSSYSLAMNMVVVSEQLWGSWKQTKEIYNPIQNFTYQGGLAFAGATNPNKPFDNQALYSSISKILNPDNQTYLQNQIFESLSPSKNGWYSWGSCNLQAVIFSNRMNLPLDILQSEAWQTFTTSGQEQANYGIGFFLPNNSCTFDFRQQRLTWAIAYNLIPTSIVNNLLSGIADIFTLGYTPNTTNTSEIGFLASLANIQGSYIAPNVAWTLNSMSYRYTHMLEINYKDGIVYTNANRGHGGFLNSIANWLSGIADKIIGYVPGDVQFFMNTAARTYNLFIPSSLLPLFQQYLDPSASNYNAVPLDIFNNSYDNNTAVGQLQYMSGYQFSLTDQYYNFNNTIYTTVGWGRLTSTSDMVAISGDNLVSGNSNGQTLNEAWVAPSNSFMFFETPTGPSASSFIINEANIKQLGQSNLHITYLNNVQGKEISVGEEWVVNNAKVMKNNSYIENDFDYRVYDEYNTSFASNEKPFIDLEYAPTYSKAPELTESIYTLPSGQTQGWFSTNSKSLLQGIVINSSNADYWTSNTEPWFYNNYSDSVITQNQIEYPYAFGCSGQFQGANNPFGNWNENEPWSMTPVSSSCINSFQCQTNQFYYENNFFSDKVNNTQWIAKAHASSTANTNGYLNASEVVINNLYSALNAGAWFTQVGGAMLWGNMLFFSQNVIYVLHHLVFNISYLLSNVQWEYRLNKNYKNIPCLVPENWSNEQIDNFVKSFSPNQYMDVGFVDENNNLFTFSQSNTTIQYPFNVYAYNKNETGTWDLSGITGSNMNPYSYMLQTFFNGGGVIAMESYQVDNVWTTANFNAGNGYGNNDVKVLPWAGETQTPPTKAPFNYKNKKYNIIMIAIKN